MLVFMVQKLITITLTIDIYRCEDDEGLDEFLLEVEAVDEVGLFFPKLNCSNPKRYHLSAFVKL